jgi:hypothetical protein
MRFAKVGSTRTSHIVRVKPHGAADSVDLNRIYDIIFISTGKRWTQCAAKDG